MSLRSRAAGGAAWSLGGNLCLAGLQLLQLSLLARLVDKAEFGLAALVAAAAAVVRPLLDLGLGNAIVQRRDLSNGQLSTLYWLGLVAGFAAFGAVVVAAPFLCVLFDAPEISRVILPVAATFPLFSAGTPYQLVLQRELRFRAITAGEVTAKAAGFAVTITLAWAGHGVWAIVWGIFSAEAVRNLWFVAAGWRLFTPRHGLRPGCLRGLASFGAYQLGERTINTLLTEMDTLVIGKLLGREALGVYAYARQLVLAPAQMILPVVSRVAFPALASVQGDAARFRSVFLRGLRSLALLLFPLYGLLIVLADELVLVCFGREWGEVLLVSQVLCLHMSLRSVYSLVGAMAIARGRVRRIFLWNLAHLLLIPAVMIALAPGGLRSVAWGWVGISAITLIPSWRVFVWPLAGVSLPDYLGALVPPAMIAALALGTGLAVQPFAPGLPGRLMLVGLTGGAIALAATAWANRDLIDLFFRRGKSGRSCD